MADVFYGSNGVWDELEFYLYFALFTTLSAFEMIAQSILLPNVFKGIGEGEFKGQAAWHKIKSF